MKDNRLEKEFEEYFQGVNIPNDITADAKKSVKPKGTVWPKVVKFASVAASIVLVFAITLTVMFTADFKKSGSVGDMSSGSAPSSPSGPSGDADEPGFSGGDNACPEDPGDSDPSSGETGAPSAFEIYTDRDITINDENADGISSIHSSLKFIEDMAADGTRIENCKSAHMNGELAFVKADIIISDGNEQTCVYVEFTDSDVVYSNLTAYYGGDIHYYNGVQYYLSKSTDGECRLLILDGGVKYYFDILSSDELAYRNYLNLIIG